MYRWLALGAFLALLWLARSVLPPFVLAAITAYVLSPLVDTLSARFRTSRLLAAAGLYVVTLGVVGVAIAVLEPRLVTESRALVENGPAITRGLFNQIFGAETVAIAGNVVHADEVYKRAQEAVAEYLGRPSDALHLVVATIEFVAHLLLFLIVSFYFIVDAEKIGDFTLRLLPPEHRDRARSVAGRVHGQLGRYLQGQLFLIVLMSTVTWIALQFVFNLRFALPIAILTGVLEVIPIIGPITATAIAASVALTTLGLWPMVWVIVAYTVLRQLEDQLVMPVVVGRAVHLHPVVTLFAVLAGGVIAGLLGMLLAIPAAAAVNVVFNEWLYHLEGSVETPAAAPAEPNTAVDGQA